MTDRPNSRYRADTDVNQINQTKLASVSVTIKLLARENVELV